ncbi:MarR family winged helix-turn-helix transcriptional regulator [Streptomyces sp. MAR4 CNX-425]|uniref:MarR family winged helix-turn-helix transcriptional regulator n=1 Tax=Streptomyces sp. MAR4 CNX-425 TaxID=3406343 RepID=UPI003B5036D3
MARRNVHAEAARAGVGTRAGGAPGGVPDEDDPAPFDPAALLDAVATTAFRLNGQFLARGDRLAAPARLTTSRWQVLYAVYHRPLPVAGVARALGVTRQSVQRLADALVARGLAAYEPNPAHRRAKLLRPTPAGRRALARLGPGHAEFAARLGHRLGGEERFRETLAGLRRLSAAMEALQAEDAEEAAEVEAAEVEAADVEVADAEDAGPPPAAGGADG